MKLHAVTEDRFPQLLTVHRNDAVKVMKDELLKAQCVLDTFSDIVGGKGNAGSDSLLDLIVVTFLKSKQKQLLSDYGLAPSKNSVALRNSLRQQQTKENSKEQPALPEISAVKSKLTESDCAAAVDKLVQLVPSSQEVVLESLTVSNLKMLLRHNKQPIGSDSKAQKILRLLDFMAKQRAAENRLEST